MLYFCLSNHNAMKRILFLLAIVLAPFVVLAEERFPDGTPIDKWFYQHNLIKLKDLGERFVVTDYGVKQDSTLLQTQALQAVIDRAAESGGVVVIPKGVFLSGALFFKQGTHLHLERGAVLKGSDDIYNFPIVMTRIEGQTLKYFAALVNADNVDGFTISGEGTIDGNGLRYWRAFWLRRQFNPQCTNMDEMRPRLVYISNAKNVRLEGVTLQNSPFWTCHIYRSERVQIDGVSFYAPSRPVQAPSTDAIDLDACRYVLVKNCYMSVNDDAVALKGGKGPWADKDPNNGGNERIIIEDCEYGFCHSCLTCGSESIHNRNIILRRIKVDNAGCLLRLKMRPDTPQNYEYITVENITGNLGSFLHIHPWTQFFDLKGREDKPMSFGRNIVMRNIELECRTFFDVRRADDQYRLSDFTFENLKLKAENGACDKTLIDNLVWKNVQINC